MQNATEATIRHLTVGQGTDIREIAMAYRAGTSAEKPLLVWLGGYRSDMEGTKALEMEKLGLELGLATLRFDYSGHGQSGGAFRDGTISRWLEESLAVISAHPPARLILVGSSMGGWIALRMAQELRKAHTASLSGMVLIAPAPDFTCELIEPALTEAEKQSLQERGYFEEPSEYSSEPNIFTKALLDDGRQNRVFTGMIETGCPVHILQGMKDPDVPFAHALKLMEFLPADDVVLTLIRDGDHRLSRPQDIERMRTAIISMA